MDLLLRDQERAVLARLSVILYLLVGELTLPPCAASETVPSSQEVKAEFEETCRSMKDSDEPHYGEGQIRVLRKQLQAPISDPTKEAVLRGRLGTELLELGRPEEAIEVISQTLETVREKNLDPRLRIELMISLGLAHLRAAEVANCVIYNTPSMCILPFGKEGFQKRPEHIRLAGDIFLQVFKEHPNLPARWLFNLARMASGNYPAEVPHFLRLPQEAFKPETPFPRWRDRAPELGVRVLDLAGGAVMDDFDGDGLLDLVTSTSDHCGSLMAFRNDGRGRFQDVTGAWGLDSQLGGLNLVHADFNNDGWLDLLVVRGAWLFEHGRIRNSLLRNDLGKPRGRFVDVTKTAGLAYPAYPTQTAAWADFDGDGDLDLYVGNEATDENPYPSQLFRNNGDGTFTDIASKAGVSNLRYAKGVAWGDFDNDGDPDLYVSNIDPNRLYRNNSDGTFTDVAPALGITEPVGRSFATWFFDFDNDGDLDLFVADYSGSFWAVTASYFGFESRSGQPLIYRNDGDHFTEVSREMGLTRPLLPMGANYGDLDNDGWLDIYLGTGNPGFQTLVPNVMLRNDRGTRFIDVTYAGGFGHLQKGHGVAFGDLDNDGDQDLLHQLGGFCPGDAFYNALFENPGPTGNWITLRLQGTKTNRFGVGARIEVRLRGKENVRSIHLLAGSGGSFGGNSMQQEIGLGSAGKIEEIIIRWPGSATVQRFRDLAMNHVYVAIEGKSELVAVKLPRIRLGGTGEKIGSTDTHALLLK